MMRSTGIPMRLAASRLNATALIAFPVRVRWMNSVRETISTSATRTTVIWWLVTSTPSPRWIVRGAMTCGKNLGSAPKRMMPAFSRKRETPIAVISAVMREERRIGR